MPSRSKTQSLAETTTVRSSDRGGETYSRREEKEEVEERSVEKDECENKKGWFKDGKKRGWGYASMYLWFIIAPIVIWVILFTVRPGFVTDNVNGVNVINNQKLMLWTLVGSVGAWILIYACYACRY